MAQISHDQIRDVSSAAQEMSFFAFSAMKEAGVPKEIIDRWMAGINEYKVYIQHLLDYIENPRPSHPLFSTEIYQSRVMTSRILGRYAKGE